MTGTPGGRSEDAAFEPPPGTAGAALDAGAAFLARAGVEGARRDAALLLSFATDTPKSALYARPGNALLPDAAARFRDCVRRRAAGECVAYITGRKAFRFLELEVTKDVLVPRADTETLVEAALEAAAAYPASRPVRLLDLCTGSGAVALALKHEAPRLEVSASDISAAALEVARRNAARLALDVTFIQSDLFGSLRGRFDIITANPPYVPAGRLPRLAPEVRAEPAPALDGGPDGLAVIRALVPRSRAHLLPGGALFLEAAPRQMPAIRALLEAAGFSAVRLSRDLSGKNRVIGAGPGGEEYH